MEWASERLAVRDMEEDWTGVSNQKQRRRMQNRLNQRARRMRKQNIIAALDTESVSERKPETQRSWACMGSAPRVRELLKQFSDHAARCYTEGAPSIEHLPLLIQANLLDGLRRNADLLGDRAEYQRWEGISAFNRQGSNGSGLEITKVVEERAPCLKPTALQLVIEHHPWIDMFPWPCARDNMLQAFQHPEIEGCDEDLLCYEVSEVGLPGAKPTLLVWGEPWNAKNWEISPGFLAKWGWLFIGCTELVESTNYWRSKRGEKKLTMKEMTEAMELSMPRELAEALNGEKVSNLQEISDE
ncbi:hypothetical protein P154DRAFT_439486 [Amniculicola lignicola CBS 123094]|uniref:BZIP domain-containing protein n=1 Tax=Amniculicola lignicola CBS 123094 TaxID=1392246 RepID=A0A6A5WAR2_9PLEO|nr:hypothetical protein P154DRAFT_439486 [Amniculicola lignicola CBS 123094]